MTRRRRCPSIRRVRGVTRDIERSLGLATLYSVAVVPRRPPTGRAAVNIGSQLSRRFALWVALIAAACGSNPPLPAPITDFSCQPFGNPPASVSFSVTPGPVTSSGAEQIAVALFRACAERTNGEPTAAVTNISTDVKAGTGELNGPNAGQPVWLVRIDVSLKDNPAQSHSWTEVNQATGVPTIIAAG